MPKPAHGLAGTWLRRAARWLGASLLAWGMLAHAYAQVRITVQDDRGVTHSWAAPPQRIVTLLPSLSEAVCALGACARLVGVDRYANYPESLKALPQMGGGLDPNIEAVVALKPDAVLMSSASPAAQRLEALGLKVLAFKSETHTDVQRTLARTAQLLGLESVASDGQPAMGAVSQRLWQQILTQVQAAAQTVPVRGLTVYVEVGSAPYAASTASFIGQTLTLMGVRNVVPGTLGPFPKMSTEWVLRADPDVVLLSGTSMQTLQQRPGWAALRAVRGGQVCVFSPAESDLLVRPGPRLGQAAQLMANCLKDMRQDGRKPARQDPGT